MQVAQGHAACAGNFGRRQVRIVEPCANRAFGAREIAGSYRAIVRHQVRGAADGEQRKLRRGAHRDRELFSAHSRRLAVQRCHGVRGQAPDSLSCTDHARADVFTVDHPLIDERVRQRQIQGVIVTQLRVHEGSAADTNVNTPSEQSTLRLCCTISCSPHTGTYKT